MGKLYNLGKILLGLGAVAGGYGLYKATESSPPYVGSITWITLGLLLTADTILDLITGKGMIQRFKEKYSPHYKTQ